MASILSWLGDAWESVTPWDEDKKRKQARPTPQPAVRPAQGGGGFRQDNSRQQSTARPTNKPGFLDYLNPFGEHGLFGAQQQRTFRDVTRPVVNTLEDFQQRIDSTDRQQGFQVNDAGDYLRFAGKLLPGMAQGIVQAPSSIARGVSGIDEQGNRLNAAQRAGNIADGYISTAGVGFGGSGVLAKALLPGANRVAAPGLVRAAGGLAKSSLKEGAEETVQTFAQDLADDGRVNTPLQDYAKAAGFGALGGGMMHGAGTYTNTLIRNATNAVDPAIRNTPQGRAMIANEVARQLVPGGTIAGRNAAGFADAQRQGLVFDGVDGKQRFEVDDSQMRIKNPNGKTLGELVTHDKLFSQYPSARNIKIAPVPDPRANGGYDAATNTLYLNKSLPLDKQLDTIVHETQHFIQNTEDFARGADPLRVGADQYRRSAGEVEARAVERRRTMSEAERYSGEPAVSMPDNAITSKDSGRALSVEQIRNHPAILELDRTIDDLGRRINNLRRAGHSERFHTIVNLKKSQDIAIREQQRIAKELSKQGVMMSVEPDAKPQAPSNPTPRVPEAPQTELDRFDSEYISEQVASHNTAKEFRNSIVEGIWERNKRGRGVETFLLRDDPNSNDFTGRATVSYNTPFYQAFYKENGHKPTKREIQELVDKEIAGESTMLHDLGEMSPYDRDIFNQLQEREGAVESLSASEESLDQPAKKTAPDAPRVQEQSQPRPQPRKSPKAPKVASQKKVAQKDNQASQSDPQPDNRRSSSKSATETDIRQYVEKQVKAQQVETKQSLRSRIDEFYDNARHALVDDTVAYERYIKDKKTQAELREGVDRVRGSAMMARQFAEDNGMSELGKMKDADLDEFQQYLIAKRAVELESKEIKTGRDLDMDRALIKSVGDKYKSQEKLVRDYSKKMLDFSVDNGLITRELADKLVKENPDYVPMNRVMEEVEANGLHKSKQLGNLTKQTVVQKIKGSERTVENPIESLIINTERMVNEAQRNLVAQRIATSEAFSENILKDGEKPRVGYDTLSYLKDGKKVTVEVPSLVAKEMRNLNNVMPDWYNGMMKIVGAPTRLLRTGATSANPIFAVSNLVRDQLQTTITGNVRANIKGTPKAFRAAFDPTAGGKKLRAELRRNGIIGNEYRMTYGYKSGDLMRELQYANQLPKQTWERLRNPIDALADLVATTENFTRAQQFYGTKGDITARSQAARNNTLNFSRGGVVIRELNKIIPFLNAGVQGGRITVKQFRERPVRTTLAFTSLAGVALAAKAVNTGVNEELFDRVSDEEKKQNLILFGPNAHYDPNENRIVGLIKIPMPQMTYPLLDAVNNLKGKPEDLARLAGDLFTATTGIDATNPINQLTPTFAKPAVEIGLNKSLYTGQDVVSEYEKNEAPEDMGKKYTTGVARRLAEVTGMPAPWVDNIISNFGGGLAKDLSKSLSDNPDNPKDARNMFSQGFGRRFGSAAVTSQYDIQGSLAKEYKKQLRESDAFKSMSREDQVNTLDKVDADTRAIAGQMAKMEQGRGDEIKRDLTARQKELVENGFNADSYLKSVQSTASNGVKISGSLKGDSKATLERYNGMSADEREQIFNTENDAEYKYNLAKYENDKANGTLTAAEDIRRKKSLRKDKVGKDYSKNTRSLYELSKADLAEYLSTEEEGVDKQKLWEEIQKYDRALYDAGLISYTKFRYGLGSGRKSSGGGKGGGGRRGTGITQAKEALALQTQMNKIRAPQTQGQSAPRSMPQMQRVALRKYAVKDAKISKKDTKIRVGKA